MWRPGLAALYAELGMLDEARAQFEELAPDSFAAVPRDSMWPACLTFLAETCLALGDTDRAGVLFDELVPFRDRNLMAAFTICFGPADRLLGGLAELSGQADVADRHFQAALELAERSGSPLWTAEVLFDWAAALSARGDVPAGRTARSAGQRAGRTDRHGPAHHRVGNQPAGGPPSAVRTVRARGRGAAMRRRRTVQPRDRPALVHQPEHRGQPHPHDPAQDRVRQPHRGDHATPIALASSGDKSQAGAAWTNAGHFERPQFGGDRDRSAVRRRSVSSGVAVGKRR